MTSLQTRPSRSAPEPDPTRTRAPGPSSGGRAPRPLAVSAAVAGAGVALAGLVVLQAVALTGWFLADGGGHGTTRDALRVGADAWLVGHGSHLSYAGVDYTVVPLGLSLLLGWAAYRAGRWAGSSAALAEDRELVRGAVVFGSGYVVVAVVTAVLAGTADVSGDLVLTVLGALVLGAGAGTAGLLSGTGRWRVVGDRLPTWAGPVLRSAATVLGGVLACAAALVAVSFVLHLGSATTMLSGLGLRPGDAVMLGLLSVLLAPNAVLMGSAYLVGPGFAVGTGTTISPTVVLLGPVPAFPLLAALPDDGPTPWFATATLALPPLVAALAVARVQRRHPVRAWDVAALRGVGSGVLAGIVLALLVALGGGALGDGRMADLGAPVGQVLVAACVSMGLGGLIGALVTTFFQRRRPVEEEPAAVVTPVPAPREPVVVVPARPDEETVRLSPDRAQTGAAPQVVTGEVVDIEERPAETPAEGAGAADLLSRFLDRSRPSVEADPTPDPETEDTEDTVQVRTDQVTDEVTDRPTD